MYKIYIYKFIKNKYCDVFFGILGIFVGGNDVVDFFDVGVVNYKVFNGIVLENGCVYYVIVIGIWKVFIYFVNILMIMFNF